MAGVRVASNPLIVQTFEGTVSGMNQANPPFTIDPKQTSRILQDILLDKPGLIRRRGPVQKLTGSPTIAYKATGIAATIDRNGAYKLAVLAGNGTNAYLHLLNSSFTSVSTAYPWFGGFTDSPRYDVDSSACFSGGTLIGTSSTTRAVPSAVQALAYWKGSTKPNYTVTQACTSGATGDASISFATGATCTTNVEVGMFLFTSSGYLVGVVSQVNSDTSVTLEEGALFGPVGLTNCVFQPIRGLNPRVSTGLLSCSTSSMNVTGSNTLFRTQYLGIGSWDMYRSSDMKYIGTVNTVVSDLVLSLTANATVSMNNEPYIAVQRDGSYSLDCVNGYPTHPIRKLGFLTTTYAGRQWYANRALQSTAQDYPANVWFSDVTDFESVNVNKGGDWFHVHSTGGPNTPIIKIMGMVNGLAIFKENELWVIKGTDKSSFSLQKVADLSVLDTDSVVAYNGGCVFTAKEGIFSFDGLKLTPLTAQLGDNYHQAVLSWTAPTDQAHAFIARDHYFVHLTNYKDPLGVTKGSTTTNFTSRTLCVNLLTGAITYMTNLQIWGSVQMPIGTGLPPLYLVNTAGGVTSICDSQYLFNGQGTNDTITCDGLTAGPDFYWETARHDMGDGEHKKLFKQLAMQYICPGGATTDTLTMDTVPGLTEGGTTVSVPWHKQTVFTNARIKFLKRSTHMGLRIYQTANTLTDVQIGPYAIGFKWQRVGRI